MPRAKPQALTFFGEPLREYGRLGYSTVPKDGSRHALDCALFPPRSTANRTSKWIAALSVGGPEHRSHDPHRALRKAEAWARRFVAEAVEQTEEE